MDIYEDDGTYLASQYCTLDSHGNIVKQVHVSAGGQMRTCDYQWTYDDAARTATCVDEAEGTTEKYWYDEQGRWIKMHIAFRRMVFRVRLQQHTPMSPAEEVFG